MAGLMGVPAIITKMDDNKSAEVAIVENVQRKDLSAIEEAKSYKALLDKGYLTQEELAKKMGLSQSAISNKLRLLSLSDAVQDALMDGKISERHARSLLQINDSEEQEKWLKTIIDERLTVKDLDKRLKDTLRKEGKIDEIPLVADTPDIKAIKEKATDIMSVINNDNTVQEEPKEEGNRKIPNKFFNFLEDESVNMNVGTETSNQSNANPFTVNEPLKNILEGQPDIDLTAPVVDVTSTDEADNEEVKEEIDSDSDKKDEPISQNVIEDKPNDTEEIEMLDFLSPNEETNEDPRLEDKSLENSTNESKKVDLTKANELIDKLEDDLRINNYRISISKENDIKEMRYTITIDKE